MAAILPASARERQNPPAAPSSHRATLPNGTRFLIRLENELSSGKHQPGKKFKAKTIDPIETPEGLVIEPGTRVRGHISRVEPASVTGHGRMWLSFDEIDSKSGKLYLVADVVAVPGEHYLVADERQEGEISTRTSRGRREIEAAATGAAIGAARGAARGGGGKDAATGAAAGAAAAFLMASAMGQELALQKGTKLELELVRPLYVAKR
jgi:hypothetical protein